MSYTTGRTVLVTMWDGASILDSHSVPTFARPTEAFLGVISDTPITSVTFSASGGYTLMDNFAYSQVAADPTPEAGTLLLGGIGLAALWGAMRLRRFRGTGKSAR